MSVLSIMSDNPNFSWVLSKNPETGVVSKSLRQGIVFGWFSRDTQYNLYFKDGVDKDSFSTSDFEYLSKNKYCNPLAHLMSLNTLLRDVVKKESEYDVVHNNTIILDRVYHKGNRLLEHFQNYLKVDLEFEDIGNMCYKVTISGECTLHYLVQNVILMLLFMSGGQGASLAKLNEDFILKYAKMVNDLDLPYFLRYVFARNFFQDKSSFNKYIDYIRKEGTEMYHGDTGFQRLRFIEDKLSKTKPILDVGCGEGFYALNLTKRFDHPYHAVDIDQDLVDVLQAKANTRGLDITTYNNIDQYKDEEVVDVLLVEVIEHMPLVEAEKLLNQVLRLNYDTLFVTTPNKAFNKNYLINDGEFRHDDHDWEMDRPEFRGWLLNTVMRQEGLNFDFEFVDIGDVVEGEPTTQGIIIKNKNVPKQAIITCGISGSGKSTFAKKVVESDPENWFEVNRDVFRFAKMDRNFSKYKFTKFNEQRVTEKWNKRLDQAIENGKNIVCSDTNLSSGRMFALKDKLEGEGYLVKIKYFDLDFQEALIRDRDRSGGVGYEVLLNQYKRYVQMTGKIEPYHEDDNLDYVYIVDLDGTLADKGNRNPYDMSKVFEDSPIVHVCEIVQSLLSQGHKVIFMSARTEDARQDTLEWLYKYVIPHNNMNIELYMRDLGDSRKDYVVKYEMFDNHIRGKYNVSAVIDDRKQVIEQCWYMLGVDIMNVGNIGERF